MVVCVVSQGQRQKLRALSGLQINGQTTKGELFTDQAREGAMEKSQLLLYVSLEICNLWRMHCKLRLQFRLIESEGNNV